MKSSALLLVILVSLSTLSWCDDTPSTPLDFEIRLDKTEIHPEEPIRILMCCEIKDGISAEYMISGVEDSFTEYRPQIWVSGPDGKPVPNRVKPEKLAKVLDIFVRMSPGKKYLFPLELHRWCTTDLHPGKYTVHLDRLRMEYGDPLDPKTGGGITNKHPIAVPESLSFSILEPGATLVDELYKKLYERVLTYRNLSNAERRTAKFDMNLLLHALGPVAERYQLQFLLGRDEHPITSGCQMTYWEWWYEERIFNSFMSCPSMDIAEALDKYYVKNHRDVGSTSTEIGIWHLMTDYASFSDEKIRDFAAKFVKRHPETREGVDLSLLTYDGWWSDGIESCFLELPSGAGCEFPK